MVNAMRRYVKDASGATAIEYALIASLIAVVIISAMGTLGGGIQKSFNSISDTLKGSGGTPATSG